MFIFFIYRTAYAHVHTDQHSLHGQEVNELQGCPAGSVVCAVKQGDPSYPRGLGGLDTLGLMYSVRPAHFLLYVWLL